MPYPDPPEMPGPIETPTRAKKPTGLAVTENHVVTTERHIGADASGGPIDVTLPNHSCGTNRTVAKTDDSANAVNVYEEADPDPVLLISITTKGRVGFFADDSTPYTIRGPE